MTTQEIMQEVIAGGRELAVSLSLCFVAVAFGIALMRMRLNWRAVHGLRAAALAGFEGLERAVDRLFRIGMLVGLGYGACLYCQLNGLTASPAPAIESEECQRVRTDYANLLDSMGTPPVKV